jgi:hypothetical protein
MKNLFVSISVTIAILAAILIIVVLVYSQMSTRDTTPPLPPPKPPAPPITGTLKQQFTIVFMNHLRATICTICKQANTKLKNKKLDMDEDQILITPYIQQFIDGLEGRLEGIGHDAIIRFEFPLDLGVYSTVIRMALLFIVQMNCADDAIITTVSNTIMTAKDLSEQDCYNRIVKNAPLSEGVHAFIQQAIGAIYFHLTRNTVHTCV